MDAIDGQPAATTVPVEAVAPAEGLDDVDAAQLAALSRCIVPFGACFEGDLQRVSAAGRHASRGHSGQSRIYRGTAV